MNYGHLSNDKKLNFTIRINDILRAKIEENRKFKRETYCDIILREFEKKEKVEK
jgi:hypothetical protein